MSQAGRDECQTFPVATLNNNHGRSRRTASRNKPFRASECEAPTST
jgi:hypothetical protein